MIFIFYPGISPKINVDLTQWFRGSKSNKGDLKGYLFLHGKYPGRLPKDWYSEAHQEGDTVIEVDHHRPRGNAECVKNQPFAKAENQKMLDRIEAELGFSLPQENTDLTNGYHWLDKEYRNYRLSAGGTNTPKNDLFPILAGTPRLAEKLKPWQRGVEYPLLLDPCIKEDCGLLAVDREGKIYPAYQPSITISDLLLDPIGNWSSDTMKVIRAWTSIYVYRLNHESFDEARSIQIRQVKWHMNNIVQSVIKGQKVPYPSFFQIVNYMRGYSRYSLAARSYIAFYRPPSDLPDPSLRIISSVRSNLIRSIFILEGQCATFPNPDNLRY